MNSKKISIKTTITIFLAILLVTGTIVSIFPSSFMAEIGTAQAEKDYRNDNKDDDRKSYEKDNIYYESQYSSSSYKQAIL